MRETKISWYKGSLLQLKFFSIFLILYNNYSETSVAKCRGSWVVGRGRGSWVWVWVIVVGKKTVLKKIIIIKKLNSKKL